MIDTAIKTAHHTNIKTNTFVEWEIELRERMQAEHLTELTFRVGNQTPLIGRFIDWCTDDWYNCRVKILKDSQWVDSLQWTYWHHYLESEDECTYSMKVRALRQLLNK